MTTRRQCLRLCAAGAGLAALPLASAQSGSGQLVFVYDDGPMTDYTKAFPVHQAEDAPACVGAVPTRVREDDGSLDEAHLTEMEQAGWEIAAHTVNHQAVSSIDIVADVSRGDRTIQVESDLHGSQPGNTILITDGDNEERATVTGTGTNETGDYLELADPVERPYSTADDAYERLTDDVLREEIVGSKAQLEEMGLQIDNFVFPYGRHDEVSVEMVKEHYHGIANYDFDGLNPGFGIDPYRIGRTYYRKDELTETELTDFLDTVAEDDLLGMFAGHTWYDDLTEDRIRFAIREAKARGIEVVTLREALSSQGVMETTPEASESQSTPLATTTPQVTSDRASEDAPGMRLPDPAQATRPVNRFVDGVSGWFETLL
jgi:peptidoglycan/xylan/chitin deacetylase (PgdA/CDA1 family)